MSRVEREQSARRCTTAASAAGGATGERRRRIRGPRCTQRKHSELHEEAVRQVTEAAQEIMRANVDKAKAGSLTHTRWLFGLMEELGRDGELQESRVRQSLAEMLMEQVKAGR